MAALTKVDEVTHAGSEVAGLNIRRAPTKLKNLTTERSFSR
jgi:hypothetical protein